MMRNRMVFVCFLLFFSLSMFDRAEAARREFWLTPPKMESNEAYMVPPPPFTEGIFPCSECHKVHSGPDLTVRLNDMEGMCEGCHKQAQEPGNMI